MWLASFKMASANPMRNKVTVVIGITCDVEVNWCAENLIAICLDRCNLAGMLVYFDGNSGRELISAGRDIYRANLRLNFATVNSLHFKSIGLNLSVWGQETVCTEVTVVLRLLKVTAIEEAFIGLNTVVGPFPNKATHHLLIVVDHIPVLCDITAGVTHSVSVFTQYERTGFFGIIQNLGLNGFKGRIHHADHIYHIGIVILRISILETFVVNRSGIVTVLNVFGTAEESFTKGAFITK